MGQTQSHITDNEVFNKIKRMADEEGPAAVSKYIGELLNKWKDEEIVFAITGHTAVGKSSFINYIRDVKIGHPDFAHQGDGDTTTEPTRYIHPIYKNVVFCDLPGYATLQIKKEDYVKNMRLAEYDFFLIFFENALTEDDLWMAENLLDLKRPFCFVRSKIDIPFENAKHNGKMPNDVLTEIRSKAKATIGANPVLKESKAVFLISIRNKAISEIDALYNFIEECLPSCKFESVVYAFPDISAEIINKKYQQLQNRLWKITAACAAVSALPVPGIDIAINIAVYVSEIKHYIDVFGLNQEKINSLRGFDYSELKCGTLLMPGADLTKLILQTIGKAAACGAILATEKIVAFIIPLVGSVISATTTAVIVYKTLKQFLDDLKADAEIVYKHISKEHEHDMQHVMPKNA